MTFAPPDVSRAATRRIGLANGLLWIVGTIVLVVAGATTAYSLVVSPYIGIGNGILGADGDPWDVDEPIVANQEGDVWSADVSGVIRIPAADFTDAFRATMITGGEVILYRTNPELGQTSTDDYFYPEYLGHIYTDPDDAFIVVPTGGDLELWVASGAPWEMRLTPLDAIVMTDAGVSGTGNAFVIYSGDAASARFIHAGEGIFFVDVFTAFDRDTPIIETGEINQRLSWEPDTVVVFGIESDGERGAWTIDVDELAHPTPTPTETSQ